MNPTLSTNLPLLLVGWLVGGILVWLPGLISGVVRPLIFPISAAIYALVLTLLRVLQLPANVWLLVVSAALLAGLIRFVTRFDSGPGSESQDKTDTSSCPKKLFLLAACLGILFFLFIGVRNFLNDPMGCCDNGFRWDYLSATARRLGRLDFYPPITSDHYKIYFYPDPMPLGFVATLFPLRWLGLDGVEGRSLALPLLLSQFVAGIWLLQALSQRISSQFKSFAFAALAFMATGLAANALTPSESFLMVLGVGAAVFLLLEFQGSIPSPASAFVFGLLASSPALIREYGIVYSIVLVISFFLASFRWESWRSIQPRARLILFMPVVMGCIGPLIWYGYLFAISGNPLLSLPVAGFPGHPVHAPYLHEVAKSRALLNLPLSEMFRVLFWSLWLAIPLALFFSLQVRRHWSRLNFGILFFSLLSIPLFIRSMAWTSGGYGFALKVLMPGIFLAMALLLSIMDERPWIIGAFSVLMVKSLLYMSVPGARYLVQNPITTYRSILHPQFERGYYHELTIQSGRLLDSAQVCNVPKVDSILWVTDNAPLAVELKRRGLAATTIWSPDLATVFDLTITPNQLNKILRKNSIRFLHSIEWTNYGMESSRFKLLEPILERLTIQNCSSPAV